MGRCHSKVAVRPGGPFTVGQIAGMFFVSARTVTKWIDSGAMVGYRIPLSKDRRVTLDSLNKFLLEWPEFPRPPQLEIDAGAI